MLLMVFVCIEKKQHGKKSKLGRIKQDTQFNRTLWV